MHLFVGCLWHFYSSDIFHENVMVMMYSFQQVRHSAVVPCLIVLLILGMIAKRKQEPMDLGDVIWNGSKACSIKKSNLSI